jgi:hypothetical protein
MPARRNATVAHRVGLRNGLQIQTDGIMPQDVMAGAIRVGDDDTVYIPAETDTAFLNWNIVDRELKAAKKDVLREQEITGVKGLLKQQEKDDANGTPWIRTIDLSEAGDVDFMHCQLIQGSKMLHSMDPDEAHLQLDVQFKPNSMLIFEGAINNAKVGATPVCFRSFCKAQSAADFVKYLQEVAHACETGGYPIDWHTRKSIKSIAVDAHQGQLTGKGLYLFLGHDTFCALLHFCTVHFKRAAKESLDADGVDGEQRQEAQRRMDVILADADLLLASKLTVDDSLTWLAILGVRCKGIFEFYAKKQNRMCIFPAYSQIDTLTRL